MKRLLRVLPVAIIVSLVVPAMAPRVASADSVDQQRQRVEDIVDELERLEERANQIGEDYVEAIDTKAQLEVEITAAEARVAAKEAELGELRSNLGEMAQRSFVGGGTAPLGPLFEDSSNLNDAIQREELARVALSAGNVTTDELNAFVADLVEERESLDSKRQQAEQLAASLTSAQSETDALTTEYTKARAEAESRLGQLVAEEEQRRARESARRVQQQAAADSGQSNTSGGNTNSGGGNSGGGNSDGGSGGSGSGGSGSSSTPSSSGGSAPAVSSRSGIAVQAALGQQGVPYRYATSKPGVSFDCSGLTAYAWGTAGVYLPHQSRAQYASVPHVPVAQAQPGDLIFFYSPISHVSVYLGNGMQVHAPNTGSTVKTAAVNWGKVTGVGRPG
ncbi:MAG: C40 family peptidase [Ilumatobacteraceae bacterium]|nr:C40 family peptidase [Ilumatobacteraceae bacterium]